MKYLLTVSYNGSKFYGFQRLKKHDSVQNRLEYALKKITKHQIEIKGAGRTDKGVHAYAQKCHFEIDLNIDLWHLKRAINDRIGNYIHVRNVEIVENDFHARFDVKEKEYVYKINVGEYDPLLEDYTWQIHYKINLNVMKKASKYLIGTHDFSSFISGKIIKKETTINNISFVKNKNIIEISFKGTHFYQYMIRNMVGALVEVGRGNLELEVIQDLIDNPKNGSVLPTAKANGLYLYKIDY